MSIAHPRRRWPFLAVCLVWLAALAAAHPAEAQGRRDPATLVQDAEQRQSPAAGAPVIATLSAGDAVEVLEMRGEHAKVDARGRTGWVAAAALRLGDGAGARSGAARHPGCADSPDCSAAGRAAPSARPRCTWLARHTERPDLSWRFGVLDSGSVNAFAAPGGYVFVTRGLLAILRNESELAGVLAHEIAHVLAQHHLRAMTAQERFKLAADLALEASAKGGLISDARTAVRRYARPRAIIDVVA